jgi:hypothetical protein
MSFKNHKKHALRFHVHVWGGFRASQGNVYEREIFTLICQRYDVVNVHNVDSDV